MPYLLAPLVVCVVVSCFVGTVRNLKGCVFNNSLMNIFPSFLELLTIAAAAMYDIANQANVWVSPSTALACLLVCLFGFCGQAGTLFQLQLRVVETNEKRRKRGENEETPPHPNLFQDITCTNSPTQESMHFPPSLPPSTCLQKFKKRCGERRSSLGPTGGHKRCIPTRGR